ncbi:MAG: PAS domain S-box-containing protein [Granulosicoccus sp.]|jgi:PAS domain S-box-containing protein
MKALLLTLPFTLLFVALDTLALSDNPQLIPNNHLHNVLQNYTSNYIIFISGVTLSVLGILIAAYYLYKKEQILRLKEQALDEYYAELTEQSAERNDKIYEMNNQLYQEIAKQEDTEALLLEAKNYLRGIINSMPSILIGIDKDGFVTHWNNAAQEKTHISYDDALGKHFQTVIAEPNINMRLIKAAIDKRKPKRLEAIQEGHGSNARFKDITIYPITTIDIESAVIRIDDVTNRIQLENMIIQNEKMSSLGELAAGVAHEINNPLGTILQSLQNIQRRLSDDLIANIQVAEEKGIDLEKLLSYLEERKILAFLSNIKDAGERAATIVTNMLEFSGTHTQKHEPLQLIDLLNRSIDLAVSSSGSHKKHNNIRMTIRREFSNTCPPVYGMAAEIQQVILNLINNAYQAYSDEYTEETDLNLDGQLLITASLIIDGSDAVIKISDNGPGMNEWTQKHIFEPFFTTKETGRGIGLGLSVSYFIITEHHQGSITVASTTNKGTTFTIRLPIKQRNDKQL